MTIRFASQRELLEQLWGFSEGLVLACDNPSRYFILLNSDDFEAVGFPDQLLDFAVLESMAVNHGVAQV
jgi:hypothetical protein